MIKQTVINAVTKHGVNLLKIGAIVIVGSISNQALKILTKDTLLEMVRDVRKAKAEYEERKEQAA